MAHTLTATWKEKNRHGLFPVEMEAPGKPLCRPISKQRARESTSEGVEEDQEAVGGWARPEFLLILFDSLPDVHICEFG